MEATTEMKQTAAPNRATVERTSDRETVVTRTVSGPARLVFDAWTKADLLKRWWSPRSFPIELLSVDTDPRVGGKYRLEYGYEGSTMEFFGQYLEVTPPSRLVWTNDEADGHGTVTTVTFEESDGKTRVVVHDLYPTKEELDEAQGGAANGMPEQLEQLEELVVTLAA